MLAVECDAESDGHGIRVATPRKLPQNIQNEWNCHPHSRGSWEEYNYYLYPNFAPPEVGPLWGPGLGARQTGIRAGRFLGNKTL